MKTAWHRIAVVGPLALAILVSTAPVVRSSGSVGIYAVLEKVVFEPSEQTPERIQLWGAFAFVDARTSQTTMPRYGYLYFKVPSNWSAAAKKRVQREWSDLKSVAGTGAVVAFGDWFFTGRFTSDSPEAPTSVPVRVQTKAVIPSEAVDYSTNTGVVKVSSVGNQSKLVEELRAVLRK